MILYFSASGNSRFVAEFTAESLNDECVCLNDRIKNENYETIYSDVPFILVCPIFAWRIPKIVEKYLKEVHLRGNNKIYLFVTTCGSSGNAGEYAEKLFTSFGMKWMGWYTFYMPGSYVAFMENPDLKHAEEMNETAKNQIKTIIPLIRSEEELKPFRVTSAGKFMSFAANPFFYQFIIGRPGFYTTDQCVGCGKCSMVCPMNNIEMNEKNQNGRLVVPIVWHAYISAQNRR